VGDGARRESCLAGTDSTVRIHTAMKNGEYVFRSVVGGQCEHHLYMLSRNIHVWDTGILWCKLFLVVLWKDIHISTSWWLWVAPVKIPTSPLSLPASAADTCPERGQNPAPNNNVDPFSPVGTSQETRSIRTPPRENCAPNRAGRVTPEQARSKDRMVSSRSKSSAANQVLYPTAEPK
jgi:hypothetical protein